MPVVLLTIVVVVAMPPLWSLLDVAAHTERNLRKHNDSLSNVRIVTVPVAAVVDDVIVLDKSF